MGMAVQEKTLTNAHGSNPYAEDATREGLVQIARAIGMSEVENGTNAQGAPTLAGVIHVRIDDRTLACDVVLTARNVEYGYSDNGYGVDVTTMDTSVVAAGGSDTAPVPLGGYVRFNRRAAVGSIVTLRERLREEYAVAA